MLGRCRCEKATKQRGSDDQIAQNPGDRIREISDENSDDDITTSDKKTVSQEKTKDGSQLEG